MTRPIRWLHLSDLHYGCPGKELWEQVEQELFRDLDAMIERVGAPDLLLFTGDLAYSGTAAEYEEVDRFLHDLLAHFRNAGAPEPILVAVPGNHDVARPTGKAAREFHILRSFDGTTDDPIVAEIYDDLWKRRDASFIDGLFPGYRPWFERRIRPQLEARATSAHFSHFPCDFTAVVEPEGAFPLALVGLDSTWMQYAGGDFDGKLLIPIEQFRTALAPPKERKPYALLDGKRALLLMHQPPDWLSVPGRDLFDASIYPPPRFTACLFGHLHRGNGTLFQTGGGKPRVFLQSPSLFGMEHWGKKSEHRAFGYTWGQLTDDREIRLWPRKADRRLDGSWSFGHDPAFHEDPAGVVLRPGERSTSTVAVARRGVDLRGYLKRLIEHTETLQIRGIAGAGNRAAIAPPIEDLYTPLRTRSLGDATEDSSSLLRAAGTDALQSVLKQRERVLIEGDPGAGKTTFLRLVACMLARDADGRPCTGHARWAEGYLGLKLEKPPVPILLRLAGLVPLLTEHPEPKDRSRLLDLFAADWKAETWDLDFDREHWERLLQGGGAWLLLDGLDEVADLDLRARLFAVLRDAAASWKAPIVVASRPFQTEKLRELGFLVATVEPFRNEEIEAFLAHWTAAIHRQAPDHAEEGVSGRYLERLKGAILTRPAVRALARNPVMLTCLCIVHWNRGDLPDVRSRVYEAVIHWLLAARKELRRQRFGVEPDLAERALSLLALHAMSTAQGKQSILETSTAVTAVRPAFERFFQGEDAVTLGRRIREWLLFECGGSGVIQELAEGRIRFWNIAFQEYLAALELARGDMSRWWSVLGGRFDQAQWWETTELFATCLYDLGQPEAVDSLLARLLETGGPPSQSLKAAKLAKLAEEARMVGVVGRLLQPLRTCGYRPSAVLQQTYDEALRSIMAIFAPAGAAQVPVEDRIAAAEALGRGGDPRLRPEVDNFLPVPGTDILLGKYPVTVQEYQRFVDARGYEEGAWWSMDGWATRSEKGWSTPEDWAAQIEAPNRPVVGVSWWEATAYCRWLSEQAGRLFRLPASADWEAAADLPFSAPLSADPLAPSRPSPLHPTPVGINPEGASPYGHLDMFGNVSEWCLDEETQEAHAPVPDLAAPIGQSLSRALCGGGRWFPRPASLPPHRMLLPHERWWNCGFRLLSASASLYAEPHVAHQLVHIHSLVADGDLSAARAALLSLAPVSTVAAETARVELGYLFNLDLDESADSRRREAQGTRPEWRRQLWLATTTQPGAAPSEAPQLQRTSEEGGVGITPGDLTDAPTPTRLSLGSSEEKGELLEQSVLRLLRNLFVLDSTLEAEVLQHLSQQPRGTQLGFDIQLKFLQVATNSNVLCAVECKAVDQLTDKHILSKLSDVQSFHRNVDHFIVVAPHATLATTLKAKLEEWQASAHFPFDIQAWCKDTQIEEFFGLVPEVFDRWFPASRYEPHPRDWTPEHHAAVRRRWLQRLDPPLRLPAPWNDYVRTKDSWRTLTDEPSATLEQITAQFIEPRGLDETGTPLRETLMKSVSSWLASSRRTLLLLGDFGDGKSVFTYFLGKQLLAAFRRNPRSAWLPVRFSLRDFSRRGVHDARDFLARRLDELSATTGSWRRLTSERSVLVILDGIDEMTKALDRGSVAQAVEKLSDACATEFRDQRILLTCRTSLLTSLLDKRWLLDLLDNPLVIQLCGFDRNTVVRGLHAVASTSRQRARLQSLRTMHDPVGLACKPLFFEMISRTLLASDRIIYHEADLYENYARECLSNKYRRPEFLASGDMDGARLLRTDEVVDNLIVILEMIALEIHQSQREFVDLRGLLPKFSNRSHAELLWEIADPDSRLEEDAQSRVGLRSLLRRVDGDNLATTDSWPVDFCHRSIREYFVARRIGALLRTHPTEAKTVLSSCDLGPEIVHFATAILQADADSNTQLLHELALSTRGRVSGPPNEDHRRLGRNATTLLYRCRGSLPGDDWSHLMLDGADLGGSDLSRKSFVGTSLRSANLDNAILVDSDFRDADVTGVRLEETAEVRSLYIPPIGGRLIAGYSDGRITAWDITTTRRLVAKTIFDVPGGAAAAGRLSASLHPGSDLCVLLDQRALLADETNEGYRQVAAFGFRPDVIHVVPLEGRILVVERFGKDRYRALVRELEGCSTIVHDLEEQWLCDIAANSDAMIQARPGGAACVSVLGVPGSAVRLEEVEEAAVVAAGPMSESGTWLVACGERSGHVGVWEVLRVGSETVEITSVARAEVHFRSVTAFAFLDNQTLFSGGSDKQIRRLSIGDELRAAATYSLRLACRGIRTLGLRSDRERRVLESLSQ